MSYISLVVEHLTFNNIDKHKVSYNDKNRDIKISKNNTGARNEIHYSYFFYLFQLGLI